MFWNEGFLTNGNFTRGDHRNFGKPASVVVLHFGLPLTVPMVVPLVSVTLSFLFAPFSTLASFAAATRSHLKSLVYVPAYSSNCCASREQADTPELPDWVDSGSEHLYYASCIVTSAFFWSSCFTRKVILSSVGISPKISRLHVRFEHGRLSRCLVA